MRVAWPGFHGNQWYLRKKCIKNLRITFLGNFPRLGVCVLLTLVAEEGMAGDGCYGTRNRK
jgi:hypothetical protein